MRLKYFSKKDGWDQYWDILNSEVPYEDIHVRAMQFADNLTSKTVGIYRFKIIRRFGFIKEYNKYLRKNN